MLSVIIPAHNEEGFIGPCLEALLAQDLAPDQAGQVEVIVAANGCTDKTVEIARGFEAKATAAGWGFQVLDIPEGGKTGAMNRAEDVARGDMRAFLDADVICGPGLISGLLRALDRPEPTFASGRMVVPATGDWWTDRYVRFWSKLPLLASGVPGAGLFTVNAPGRARWGKFPETRADDTYVRRHFTPEERIGVDATYAWPITMGFWNLVKVRRRQDTGVAQVDELVPHLAGNERDAPFGLRELGRLFVEDPVGFVVYALFLGAVRVERLRPVREWTRRR